jgi:hypothetical protein
MLHPEREGAANATPGREVVGMSDHPHRQLVRLLRDPGTRMTGADLTEAARLAEHYSPPAAYELALRHYRRAHPEAPAHEADAFAAGVRWLAEERAAEGVGHLHALVLGVRILAEGRTP